MVILSNLTSLSQSLQSHHRCVSRLPSSRLLPLLDQLSPLTDDQRLEVSGLVEVETTRLVCEIIYPGTVSKYDSISREYSGYCPVALLSGGGLLLPGNPRLGTLRQTSHKHCQYLLVSYGTFSTFIFITLVDGFGPLDFYI